MIPVAKFVALAPYYCIYMRSRRPLWPFDEVPRRRLEEMGAKV